VRKSLVASLAFLAVLACSFTGAAGTSTAEATVTTPVVVATPTVAWPKDVVYVYDMTAKLKKADGSPRWPVAAAAEKWDNDNPTDYRYTTTPCPAGAQCVVVQQKELAAPAVGTTATAFSGTAIVSAAIVLDTTFGKTGSAARRRNVVCHELGHALGLQHRTGTTSCMSPYVSDQRYPDKVDVQILGAMYKAA
jgi:hypothetical protein